uniref:Pentatricopeptide repeat-containing protein At3g29230 n=1 Tax=Anthurium amnicola TaxID=1678845 RepID=A0A1D1YEI6_9ARAE
MPLPVGRKLYQLCRDCQAMTHLKQILAQVVLTDASNHTSSLSALVAFSATSRAGDLHFASLLFSQLQRPGSFAYNSMIQGLVNAGFAERALTLYTRMLCAREGPYPDKFTFPFVVKACALLSAVGTGRAIHGSIVQSGLSLDPYVCSALVSMYSEFGEVVDARILFYDMPERDCVLWNSMIGGYVKCGLVELACLLFEEMPHKNAGTYNALIGGYVKLGCMERARKLFEEMPERDVLSWNTMVGAHARLGSIDVAWELFYRVPERNVTTWSAIISGFAQSSQFCDALEGFRRMLADGMRPNQAVLVSTLSSCAHLGALEQGIWIHGYIERQGVQIDDVLGASLIDMYSKCGFLLGAKLVFKRIERRDVCTWTSMIYGLALHGLSHEAVNLFIEMERLQVRPNKITFVAILSACSHAGLVDRGREIFHRISRVYNMNPTIEHYTCMVDILSRANQLEEAQRMIESMPMEPDVFVWGALLSGFRIHGYHPLMTEDLGKELARLSPTDSGTYVLASNIYASTSQWDHAVRMRAMMAEFGVRKNPGSSSVEVDQIAHEFLAGGTVHPMSKQVYEMLDRIYKEIKTGGLLQ